MRMCVRGASSYFGDALLAGPFLQVGSPTCAIAGGAINLSQIIVAKLERLACPAIPQMRVGARKGQGKASKADSTGSRLVQAFQVLCF